MVDRKVTKMGRMCKKNSHSCHIGCSAWCGINCQLSSIPLLISFGMSNAQFSSLFYYPHHRNMIIDRFAAKVGEPCILQTNLTKCFFFFFFFKNTMWQDKFYIEKKQTQKRKKKRRKTSHLYIIHTIVYMQHNGEKIVKIIITI